MDAWALRTKRKWYTDSREESAKLKLPSLQLGWLDTHAFAPAAKQQKPLKTLFLVTKFAQGSDFLVRSSPLIPNCYVAYSLSVQLLWA